LRLGSGTPGPLRRRDFRLVYLAATVSVIGDRFAFVALPFAVIAANGSLGDVGLIVAAETLSRGAFLLFGGVVADRMRRSRVMVVADLVRAGTQGGLAALIISGNAGLPALVGLQALHGAASAFFDPASTGLVAEVVPSNELQPANAQLSISRGLATFLGPLLAGFLIVAFSPGVALAVDASTFLLSAAFLVLVSRTDSPTERAEPERLLHELRVGFREFLVRPWLPMLVGSSGILLMALLGTLFVLGPAVASESLGGADAWGVVVGAFGLGSVLGGVVALRVPARRQLRSIFAVALITIPAILLLAIPSPIGVLVPAFLVAGVAMSYAGTVYEVVLQQWIPASILARIASYDWLATTVLSSLGLVLAGRFAELIGVRQTLIGAAAVVAVAAAVPLVSPAVRRADASHAGIVRRRPAPGFGREPANELATDHLREPVIVLPDPPADEISDDIAAALPDPPHVVGHPD
jgi:MFS family permease